MRTGENIFATKDDHNNLLFAPKSSGTSCKIVMALRDLKSDGAIADATGVQDKVIQRWAPATLPASNSSTKPIKRG